jgi:hypothetical protein
MKYYITHSCGHEERVDITGTNVHGERDRKAERMESKPCRACEMSSHAATDTQAAESNSAEGMPSLDGSAKQVAWAETIRRETLDAIASRSQHLHEAGRDDMAEVVEFIRRHAGTITDAAWWIDNRRDAASALSAQARPAWEETHRQ